MSAESTELALNQPADALTAAQIEAQAAALDLLRGVVTTFSLAAEERLRPREVAARMAHVIVTGREEDGRAVVLVVAPSEQVVHDTVEALRRPVSIRFKEIGGTSPESLPAPSTDTAEESSVNHTSTEPTGEAAAT